MSRPRHPVTQPPSDGFTLVELLVTMSLMALVAGTMVAALSGGLRVWERTFTYGTVEQASLIAAQRIERDLAAARRFRLVPFKGSYDRFAFAAVDRDNPDALPELGQLGFRHWEGKRMLCRSFIPYRLTERVHATDRCQAILDDVTRVRFDYFGKDHDSGQTGWSARWESTDPPIAVKATLTIQPPRRAAETRSFLVYLPTVPPPKDRKAQATNEPS